MAAPKSVALLNKFSSPYVLSRIQLGTVLNEILDALRAIHAELITDGQLQARIQDLEDKAYNMCVSDPGWAEDAVTQTEFENAGAISAVINGVYVANVVAAGTNQVPAAGWATGAGQTRLVTLAVNAAGTVSQTVSAVGATIAPRPPSGECPVGVVSVPANFTPGTTHTSVCTFTDGFPRRLAVHTPITVAAPDVLPDLNV